MPERILIAEDQDDLRQHLAEFLRHEGYETLAAADGREAYALVVAGAPDLVISDLGMPDWDGQRLFAALAQNAHTAHLPVIFLSAWADRQNIRRGMEMGAADYITKPFTLAEVSTAVKTQLARARRQDARLLSAREEARLSMLSFVPHELLTPLNGIVGPLEILAERGEDAPAPERRRTLDLARHSARHLERAIKRVLLHLDLELDRARRPGIDSATGDALVALTNAAAENIRSWRGGHTPVQIENPGFTPRLAVPAHAFLHMAEELLDNALRATPPGQPVTVSFREAEGCTEVRFSDAGPGLTPAQLAAFGRDVPVTPLLTQDRRAGIGIPIVRGLLRRHGGEIQLETRTGGPTTVALRLPAPSAT